eukprot:g33672.t1
MKVATHIDEVIKKVYSMLAFNIWNIEYKRWQVMLQMYKTSVRLRLEYCVLFWLPHYMKDMEAFQRVQKKSTRILPGLECISCKERLDKHGLFMLDLWKLRNDLMEVWKIMGNMDGVDSQRRFLKVEMTNIR